MAINPLNGHLFWYDRNITAIYKADKNGADETLLLNNVNGMIKQSLFSFFVCFMMVSLAFLHFYHLQGNTAQ